MYSGSDIVGYMDKKYTCTPTYQEAVRQIISADVEKSISIPPQKTF